MWINNQFSATLSYLKVLIFDFYGIFRLQEVKSHLVQPKIKTTNPKDDTWFNMKPIKKKSLTASMF